MTRKDYIIIAASIDAARMETRHDTTDEGFQAVSRIARELASALRIDNGRFDEARFLKACGL